MRLGNNLKDYNVGIYVRESRDENEENYETIETQRDLLMDFIKRNKVGKVVSIYVDDNVSGAGFERGGIYDLRKDVENGKIDMLVMKDLSRLGRNNAKTLLFLDFLEEHDIRVITFDGRYDSVRDNETVGIDTWFNERYIRDISKKIRASLRFKIEKGEYIGHAPYGYKKSSEENNKLCTDEDTAPIVREIYRLYRDGYGYAYIAKLLNYRSHPSPTGIKWNPAAVRRILTNRVYIGDTVQGVSEKISFKSKKRRRLPEEQWVITKGTHEPIINRSEYNEIQRIREARRVSSSPHKGIVHLFKGVLYCGRCGSTMFARKRNNRPMGYICGNYCKNGRISCTSHYVNEADIEKVIVDELLSLLRNKEIMAKTRKRFDQEVVEGDRQRDDTEKYKKRLVLKQRQQDTLYMDRLQGNISEELFFRMNNNLENSISYLKDEMKKGKNRRKDGYKFDNVVKDIIKKMAENGVTHNIIKVVVDRITVYDKDDKEALNKAILPDEYNGHKFADGVIIVDFKLNKV